MPRRPARRLIAWLLTVTVLLAQTAALAYACAIDSASVEQAVTAPCPTHVVGEKAPASPPTSNLCEVHCQTPTVSDAGPSVVPAAALVALHPSPPQFRATPTLRSTPPEARGTPPPVLLRSTRLLI